MNDAGQIIRHYLTIARRQWWVIAQAVIIVGAVAAGFALRAPQPPFTASNTLLVRGDLATPTKQQTADLLLAKRNLDVLSPAVLSAAAAAVPGETPASIASAVRSTVSGVAGTITITATSEDAARPAAIVNAMADAYVASEVTKTTGTLRDELARQQADANQVLADLKALDASAPAAVTPLPGVPAPGTNTTPTDSAYKAQRDAILARYDQVLVSIEATKRLIASADPGVEVLFPATGSRADAKPSPITRGILGGVAGLMIGLALAALREALDNRLRDRAAIERELPWGVVGEIPTVPGSGRLALAAQDDPGGQLAEAMRRLRTNIQFLGSAAPARSIVVTSAQPGDGKTFVSANLAVSFAHLGLRTVVVSADLRRPTLDSFFIATEGPGLTDAMIDLPMAGRAATDGLPYDGEAPEIPTAERLLRYTGVPNLWLMPAGRIPPNPADLLNTELAQKVFARLEQIAEVIIIDAPPLVVVDPIILAGMADGIIVVSSIDDTKRAPTRRAREALEATPIRVLGVVINRLRAGTDTYGYYAPYAAKAAEVPKPVKASKRASAPKQSRRSRRKQRRAA